MGFNCVGARVNETVTKYAAGVGTPYRSSSFKAAFRKKSLKGMKNVRFLASLMEFRFHLYIHHFFKFIFLINCIQQLIRKINLVYVVVFAYIYNLLVVL